MRTLQLLKDYWFLVTLALSGALSVAYMVIFKVNPWDKQQAAKRRHDRVRFQNSVGCSLLESGHYKEAKVQYEEALKLAAVDQTALHGRYLAQLFLDFESPEWDPAVGQAIRNHLPELTTSKQAQLPHVVEKYLGDVHYSIGESELAREYYQRALELKPEYPDALFTLGWFHYSDSSNYQRMEECFRELARISEYDYRGFHGLGYALYMKAWTEEDAGKRTEALRDAAIQSQRAKNLTFSRLNVVVDFGEVARSVDPQLSVFYHHRGRELLEDAVLSRTLENKGAFVRVLLASSGSIRISSKEEKLAWIEYGLALDYLAMERRGMVDGQLHEQHLAEGKRLDVEESVYPIYRDELAILDRLLPASASSEAAGK